MKHPQIGAEVVIEAEEVREVITGVVASTRAGDETNVVQATKINQTRQPVLNRVPNLPSPHKINTLIIVSLKTKFLDMNFPQFNPNLLLQATQQQQLIPSTSSGHTSFTPAAFQNPAIIPGLEQLLSENKNNHQLATEHLKTSADDLFRIQEQVQILSTSTYKKIINFFKTKHFLGQRQLSCDCRNWRKIGKYH